MKSLHAKPVILANKCCASNPPKTHLRASVGPKIFLGSLALALRGGDGPHHTFWPGAPVNLKTALYIRLLSTLLCAKNRSFTDLKHYQ